ncbi:MAG: hypothetical protein KKC30_06760 [Proteobacteria bacterium]|nr:hypothetical protein [Pseudomonadota bacterium]MBU4276418.1 hypothetical protein [Pseudomonadota bacterium]MBU4381693.1 hypothetical protein [Pseudomonadota bacterium]MCG2765647.1 hypothetical protein [Desulfarculaceae bacterium]
MIALLYLAVFIGGAWLSMSLAASPLSFDAGVNILIKWLLVAFPGVGGLLAAYAHTARAEKTAAYIGWQPGSPFQFEVAMANLALGVAGVMCLWMGHGFQAATGVVFSIFVLGAARGHLDQRKKSGNKSPGNSGIFLWLNDIAAPAAILVLLAIRGIFGS